MKSRSLSLLLPSLALLTVACRREAPAPPRVEVVTCAAERRDVTLYGELVGQLDGSKNVEIRPQAEGVLQSAPFKEGSFVKKGDLLYTIDARKAQAALGQTQGGVERARAAWEKAKADVERFRPLAAKKAISQQELDNALAAERGAKAAFDSAKAEMASASVNVGFTRIASPIAGLVGTTGPAVGNVVNPSTLLTTVSVVDPIKVICSVPEAAYLTFAEKIPEALKAREASLDLLLTGDKLHTQKGTLSLVDRAVNASTGTIKVEFSFPNPGNILRPGMFAKVRGAAHVLSGAIVVPEKALAEIQGTFQVAVVDAAGKVHLQPVKVGSRTAGLAVLEEGVAEGTQVVVEGLQKVHEGSLVNAHPAKAAKEN